MNPSSGLTLPHGLAFSDLYKRDGLVRVDEHFLEYLNGVNEGLHSRLLAGRADMEALTHKQHSELIIEVAPYLEDFVGELFGIQAELRELQARHHELAPLFSVKRRFVQRKAMTGVSPEQASAIDGFAVARNWKRSCWSR